MRPLPWAGKAWCHCKTTVDYADAALESAKKQVDAAKANVQSYRPTKNTTIEAPFDGTIGISRFKMGASVSTGQTLLIQFPPMTLWGWFCFWSEILAAFCTLTAKRTVTNDTTFRLQLPDQQNMDHLVISLLSTGCWPSNRHHKARLVFNNKQNLLRSGMTAIFRSLTAPAPTEWSSSKTITEQMGEYFAFVVNQTECVHQIRLSLGSASTTR